MPSANEPFSQFCRDLKNFSREHPQVISNTLSNIFTMRLIGNKTHGDLAEVGIAELTSSFIPGYTAKHVGKDLFRAKKSEEDIVITRDSDGVEIPVSLKAYGDGPLQLSTDKQSVLFPLIENTAGDSTVLEKPETLNTILKNPAFEALSSLNVLPLIYREINKQCSIMIFDNNVIAAKTSRIVKEMPGKARKHPVWKFRDSNDNYICEVRYGGKSANALQRGLWTHTIHAFQYFDSLTGGWVDYSHNLVLTQVIAKLLNSTPENHQQVIDFVEQDLTAIKDRENL